MRLLTSILLRCAGNTAQWQMGLLAGLSALYSRVFLAREILVSIGSQPAGSLTLSPQSTLSDLACAIAGSYPQPVGHRLDAQIIPLGGRDLGRQQRLRLCANPVGDGIDVSLETAGAVPAEFLLRSLEFLLAAAARDPAGEINALAVLHEDDRERILRAWNASAWHPEAIQPVHRSFEAQVRRTPEAMALIDGHKSWTYAQLNRAANRLGARLRTEGVGVGTTVGLCVPRSAAMVVGMLGVLKSGGAFVPLDMSHPSARVQRMCARAELYILLFSRAEDKVALELGHVGRRLCIEEVIESPAEDSDLPHGATADDPAYVIFTSGSTGEPKGVIGLHRGMSNRLQWVLEHVPLAPDAICCQRAALGFIDCIGEVLSPLFCGRPLFIVPEREARDPKSLVDFLAHHRITRVTTVPTLLRMVLTAVGDLRARLPSLRTWICSGEELPADLVGLFFECCDAELYNFYGPSEASIEVSTWRCDRGDRASPVPIGRPIGNTQLYVLDAAMHPVVPGVVGELYIGGIGLARGYLGDPQLTAISFVQNPFSDDPAARLYRTGDLARHRANGVLEFVGRIGRDVKVRGNRVALGEVESAVASLPDIDEVAVVAQLDQRGACRLLAYIVAAGGVAPELETLRSRLSEILPAYMIPAHFVCLDRLPRTTSGKLDRSRLPNASPTRVLRERNTRPLSTEAERQIAQGFAETLSIPVSSADDDFLKLGGDSLQATLLLSQLSVRHGLVLSLRDFFAGPTVHALARHLDAHQQITGAGTAIALDASAGDRGIRPPSAEHASGAPREALPLCHAQERLWFLTQLDGGSGYGIATALRFEGPLLIEAVESALQALWSRHAALRAVFPERDGLPICTILEPTRLPLDHVQLDASLAEASTADTHIEEHVRWAQRDIPFDLAQGPLVRATLFTLSPTNHTLVLTIHHIVCDGISVDILVRELATLYDARVSGSAPRLQEHPASYGDHARWERDQEHGPRSRALAEVWGRRMAGAPQVLELPLDHPRPPKWSEQGATHRFRLNTGLVDSLRSLAQQVGASPFIVAHAAFAALLARLSGQNDLCIGVPAANRQRAGVSDLVGLFVNTLVLRAQVSGDESFQTLLMQVRDDCLEAFDHQDFPFERLVQQLKPERSLGHAPLVQVSFAFERPLPTQRAAGAEIRARNLDSGIALFDLSLTLELTDHEIEGVAVYSKALFEPATIARWMQYYRRLLEAAVQEPDTPIAQLVFLSADEQRMLRDFGTGETLETQTPWPSILTHFEVQANRTPDAVALVTGETRLSYRRLDTLADRLAARLRAYGVKPELLVAICGRRSADLVVAVLAVMKAGGAWLPLDPAYPTARLRFMLEDSGAALLLAHHENVHRLIQDSEFPWLALEQDDATASDAIAPDATADERCPRLAPADLAYLIYTSGSTGKPKGVMITHGALESAWRAWDIAYELSGRCHSHLQTASFSFDVFVGDLVRAFCSGAKLVMADRETLLDPVALLSLLDAEQVDCADLSPVVMRVLYEHLFAAGRDLSSLKLLVLGTDAWTADQHRKWQTLLGPDTRFLNAYGVTEATVASTYYDHRRTPLPPTGPVPIGVPLPGETIAIVDRHLEPVPIGVVGEICIGGAGVARGYRNRPALNAERFLVDAHGARCYRTGDLGRWRADATIEFLGRADAQVKIRGFRVEPGEVEEVIASHSAIRQVAVIALPDPLSGHKLRAAVVTRDRETLSVPDLLAFAARHLPDYMLPSSVLVLEALPTSPNGKIDRGAIAALEDRGVGTGRAGAHPRTPEEAAIAEILSRVLGLERIGVDDNFFELGGHSLLATQAVSQIRNTLGVTLKVRDFFEAPSVAGLAQRTRALRHQASENHFNAVSQPVRPAPSATFEELCSAAQRRLLFLHHLGGDGCGNLSYDIPALFRLRGALDVAALKRSLEHIVERHEILRTTFVLPNDTALEARQRIHPHLPMPFDIVQRPGDAGDWLDTLKADIAPIVERPFDLETGPLIRAVLFRRDEEDHALLLHMHHMVSDAWSVGVYVRELRTLYSDFHAGRSATLPPLRWQYRDFAAWQRALLDSDVLTAQRGFWKNQLAYAPALLELPGDRPRPAVRSHRGGLLRRTFGAELVAALGALGQRLHASLYMLLLAALGVLLYRRSGQEDLCIGSPIANRGDGAFEGLIGFFVNTLVMRLRLEGDPRFVELVSRVRETALDAYDTPDVPFERLVEELQPKRSLSHSPLFQVVLALQNVPTEDFALEGLAVEALDLHNGTAKFDLVIIAEHRAKELRIEVEYSEDLFDRMTVERMILSYETILRGAISAPETTISRLPILPASERQLIETTWNRTDLDFGEPRCLHHLFEAQAAKSPEGVALIAHTGAAPVTVTWRTLDHSANALARELQGLGIGPGKCVGIFCERSIEQIVAILGILKAGGAYVPLDPAYPAARLQDMAADARLSVVLTHGAAPCPDLGVSQRALTGVATRQAPQAPRSGVTPDDLIYVTYTSGSTGRPKGIAMHHAAVWNLVAWHQHETSLVAPTTIQYAPLGFDVSFQEIFATFAAGGTLILVDEDDRRDPFRLWGVIERSATQRLFLPTAALRPLAVAAGSLPSLPSALREVWVGGEQMRIDADIRALFERLSACRLVNYYGPSECHAVTSATQPSDVRQWQEAPHVGSPIANTKVHILDGLGQRVPIGVEGELCITGNCIAKGYLERPAQTAVSFVPDPFILGTSETSIDPPPRMYKTGDRAYYDAHGNIHLRSRLDGQTKIRGFRVETAEIEAVLASHPGIETAVVEVDRPGESSRLVAWVVARAGARLNASHVLEHARHALPDYMVPSSVLFLEQLPMNANGKVDRGRLRAFAHDTPISDEGPRLSHPPRDPDEAQIAQAFADLLGHAPVGRDESFFDLGGNSILAMSLVARLRSATGRPLSVAALMQHATPSRIAEHLYGRSAAAPSRTSPLVPLRTAASFQAPFFCVHPAGGNVVCYEPLSRALKRPFYGLQSVGLSAGEHPLRSIEEMADTYLEAIRSVAPSGPLHLAGWSMGGVVAYEMARRLILGGGEVTTLILLDTDAPASHGDTAVTMNLKLAKAVFEEHHVVFGRTVDLDEATLRALQETERLNYVLAAAHEAGAVPHDLGIDGLRRLLHVFSRNLEAMFAYEAKVYAGPLTVVSARDRKGSGASQARDHGWRALVSGPLEVRDVPGDHYTFLHQEQVGVVAQIIDEVLSGHVRMNAGLRP
ncbi:MAG: amino acid adenylation domain-containing protein [Methylocella sp.]